MREYVSIFTTKEEYLFSTECVFAVKLECMIEIIPPPPQQKKKNKKKKIIKKKKKKKNK